MSKAFLIKSFINHWLNVVDEHSIHSPFFFDFYSQVIQKDEKPTYFEEYEKLRNNLNKDLTLVDVKDLGAKSNHFNSSQRSIRDIARTSLSPAHYGRLYNRIISYTQATRVLELGTSMGITTLYLAHNPTTRVTTFEGNNAMINIALTNFEYFNKQNIEVVDGNLDVTLHEHLQKQTKYQFILIDANHRYEPTLRYFNLLTKRISEKGIIVIDDIHHSPEMNLAWKELTKHPLVYSSVDLFRCGLLFFDPSLTRQNYIWSL